MSVRSVGTPKTLEANGASITTGNVAQANDASYGVVADGSNYAHGEFALSCAYASAPTEHTTVDLYARPINFDSTNDAETPENTTGFKGNWYLGSFILNNVTTTQYAFLRAFDLPPEFEAYIHNNGGQTMSSGWTLKITPIAYKAST